MENERRKKEENEKVKSRKWLLFLSLSLLSFLFFTSFLCLLVLIMSFPSVPNNKAAVFHESTVALFFMYFGEHNR